VRIVSFARASVLLWTLACCAQHEATATKPARPPWLVYPQVSSFRSEPTGFLDIPGLTQVTVSTTKVDEFCESYSTRIEVLRAGKVVCELPDGGRGWCEGRSRVSSSEVSMSSREPLRFQVLTMSSSNNDVVSRPASCMRFELGDAGACRTLFARSCGNDCTLRSTTKMVPGTGKIRGEVARGGKPFADVTVQIGSQLQVPDEHGGFSFEVRPGAHEIVLTGDAGAYSPNVRVSTPPDQDAQVSIAIDCACCRDP
jgi:hypothetical protein